MITCIRSGCHGTGSCACGSRAGRHGCGRHGAVFATSNWSGMTIVVYVNSESILGCFGDRGIILVIVIENSVLTCNERSGICCHFDIS